MLVKKGNSLEMKRRSSQRGAEIFIDRVCKDPFTVKTLLLQSN